MIIIIGLGNPGEKFNKTRHNVGFIALDFFAKENDFPEFKLSKKYESLVSEKVIEKIYSNFNDRSNHSIRVILAKPQTFMNESGKAVQKVIYDLRSKTYDLVVVHDDIDLPMGKIKLSKDSGAGGHKGVDSIIRHLGKQDFVRLKIGICPASGKPETVEKFVIEKFTSEEMEILDGVIEKSAEALNFFIENGLEKTMNEFN